MSLGPRSNLIFAAGGDVLAKYGTLTRRLQIPTFGGEGGKETFARASVATSQGYVTPGVLGIVPVAVGVPRIDWAVDPVTGLVQPYALIEATATNQARFNRDLTNAVWTKTTMTAAKDQVGADGVASGASSLLATAGNATCLQAITLASSQRLQSAWIKRLVGSGTVQMTTDGGSTWVTVAITTAWARYTIPAQTVTNPSIGFRLVTNADKIAVDYVQNETGPFVTSAIANATAGALARSSDFWTGGWFLQPQTMWWYCRFLERGGVNIGSSPVLVIMGADTSGFGTQITLGTTSGSKFILLHSTSGPAVSVTTATGPTVGQVCELLALIRADGSVELRQSLNGAAETTTGQSAGLTFAPAWTANTIGIGTIAGGGDSGVTTEAFSRVLVGLGTGVLTVADARAVAV